MAPKFRAPPNMPPRPDPATVRGQPPRDPVTGQVLTPSHLGKEVDPADLHPDLRGLGRFKEKHRREAQVIYEEEMSRGEIGCSDPDGPPTSAESDNIPLHKRIRMLNAAKERVGE